AIGKIDQIARIPIRSVVDGVIDDLRSERPGFDVVTVVRVGEFTSLDPQHIYFVDVDAVRAVADAGPIPLEITVANDDRAAGYRASQNAILIVDEAAVLDRQIFPLGTDTGAIVIGHLGALESDPTDGDVVGGDDEQALATAAVAR